VELELKKAEMALELIRVMMSMTGKGCGPSIKMTV